MRRIVCLVLLNVPFLAWGLNTAYVSFQHPEGWQCELSQGVWICQSNVPDDRKEAVILSIAAEATKWDTLENYETYLKKPRRIADDTGRGVLSKIVYTRKRTINGFEWVDSLQQNSELPGFWARYLATVYKTKTSNLAILITYIVSNERYSKISPSLERMIASLKPRADFDINVASKQGEEVLPGNQVLGQLQKNIFQRLKPPTPVDQIEQKPTGKGVDTGLVVALIAIAGAYVYIRRRRKLQEKVKSGKNLTPPAA
ncbi:MAG: hypothetical protein R3B54_04025 [Bdellovibrionota bacterium]